MLLYIFATCCILLAEGFNVPHLNDEYDDPILEWPYQYTVKATKLTLTSGLVEDFTAWRTNTSSRVDYNHGAVKRITLMSNDLEDGDKYEIHPETVGDAYNEIVCNNIGDSGGVAVELDSILPDIDYYSYEYVGEEDMNGEYATKFESLEKGDENSNRIQSTIWAVHYTDTDTDTDWWAPVKYEEKTYNNKLGALSNHIVYNFYEFNTEIYDEEDKVFDVDELGCDYRKTHDINSKAVTKDLMFINPENHKHVDHVFKSFKNEYQRQYADEKEHALRRKLFQKTMRLVSSTNLRKLSYTLSINHFADRTPEEMWMYTGLRKRPEGKTGNIPFPYSEAVLKGRDDLPEEFDLRVEGVVSPVKNQETCGSCWTFGTTVAMEGALARANGGRLLSLANQALIDCAWDAAGGCDGGSDDAAYQWMMKYGLPTEEEYGSYSNYDGFCNIRNMTTLYPIRGYTDVTPYSTKALQIALINHGPLSVSVDACGSFMSYSRGIFNDPTCSRTRLNHEVALVGYSVKDGVLFWIVKNSWGTSWGIDGYIHIAAQNNICGIETEPTYVVI